MFRPQIRPFSRTAAPGKVFEMRCEVDRMVEIDLKDSNSGVSVRE